MKNKKLLLGLLAITLVFGMMATGCKDSEPEVPVAKNLKIIGIAGITSPRIVAILWDENTNPVAGGSAYTSDNITIQLGTVTTVGDSYEYSPLEEDRWKGKGNYYISLAVADASGHSPANTDRWLTVEAIPFQNETIEVQFTKFQKIAGTVPNPNIIFSFSSK
jgi:hypothetical protein